MRGAALAEIGGSLIIATLTGLYTFGGLASAGYAFLAFDPSLKALGTILLLFGIVNLPIFVMWSRQMADEIAMWAGSLRPNARDLHDLR